MTSTLQGYVPQVGDLVWQQMYSPQLPYPGASIADRVAHGARHGPRRKMVLLEVVPDYDAAAYARSLGQDVAPRMVTRWRLQPADPGQRRGEFPYSLVEDDWCVLELIDAADEGRLW